MCLQVLAHTAQPHSARAYVCAGQAFGSRQLSKQSPHNPTPSITPPSHTRSFNHTAMKHRSTLPEIIRAQPNSTQFLVTTQSLSQVESARKINKIMRFRSHFHTPLSAQLRSHTQVVFELLARLLAFHITVLFYFCGPYIISSQKVFCCTFKFS